MVYIIIEDKGVSMGNSESNKSSGKLVWRPQEEGLNEMQRLFLDRLEGLLQRRQVAASTLSREAIRFLDRAIFSTYRDCIGLGVGELAHALLDPSGQPVEGSGTMEAPPHANEGGV